MSTKDSGRFPLVSSHNDINDNSQHSGVLAVCCNLLVVTPEAGGIGDPLSADKDD